MNNDLYNKLKQLRNEDIIWIIYIGIIILSWYSNSLERDYFVNNNTVSREKYQKTLIIIFSVLLIIYFYFLKNSMDDVNNLKYNDSEKKKRLVYLSFIGSLFIVMSGLIFLYIALMDQEIEVEIAFN